MVMREQQGHSVGTAVAANKGMGAGMEERVNEGVTAGMDVFRMPWLHARRVGLHARRAGAMYLRASVAGAVLLLSAGSALAGGSMAGGVTASGRIAGGAMPATLRQPQAALQLGDLSLATLARLYAEAEQDYRQGRDVQALQTFSSLLELAPGTGKPPGCVWATFISAAAQPVLRWMRTGICCPIRRITVCLPSPVRAAKERSYPVGLPSVHRPYGGLRPGELRRQKRPWCLRSATVRPSSSRAWSTCLRCRCSRHRPHWTILRCCSRTRPCALRPVSVPRPRQRWWRDCWRRRPAFSRCWGLVWVLVVRLAWPPVLAWERVLAREQVLAWKRALASERGTHRLCVPPVDVVLPPGQWLDRAQASTRGLRACGGQPWVRRCRHARPVGMDNLRRCWWGILSCPVRRAIPGIPVRQAIFRTLVVQGNPWRRCPSNIWMRRRMHTQGACHEHVRSRAHRAGQGGGANFQWLWFGVLSCKLFLSRWS